MRWACSSTSNNPIQTWVNIVYAVHKQSSAHILSFISKFCLAEYVE